MEKKNLRKLLFSLLALAITVVLLYVANFLEPQVSGDVNLKLLVQILISTFGFFWILVPAPQPLKQNIYFASGTIIAIVALYSLALSQVDVPEIKFLSGLNIFEALTMMFAGIFFMAYGWLTKLLISHTQTYLHPFFQPRLSTDRGFFIKLY